MELAKNDFHKAGSLFDAFSNHMSIKGVIAGLVPGRIFADENRLSAAAATPQGIFLGGSLENTEFFSNMNTVLKQDILPGYEKRGQLDYVVFYPADAGGEEASHVVTRDLYPMRSKRMTFSHNMSDVAPELSGGIYEVNGDLLSGGGLSGLDGVIEEISEGWISADEFLNRGFGCVAIEDGNIIGWCLTDWVVGKDGTGAEMQASTGIVPACFSKAGKGNAPRIITNCHWKKAGTAQSDILTIRMFTTAPTVRKLSQT